MEEARRVLERLQRIEALRGGEARSSRLLDELRALLAEGEAWLAAERSEATAVPRDSAEVETARSERALAALGDALDRRRVASAATTRSEPRGAGNRQPDNGGEVVAGSPAV
jgi:hypothetical protein